MIIAVKNPKLLFWKLCQHNRQQNKQTTKIDNKTVYPLWSTPFSSLVSHPCSLLQVEMKTLSIKRWYTFTNNWKQKVLQIWRRLYNDRTVFEIRRFEWYLNSSTLMLRLFQKTMRTDADTNISLPKEALLGKGWFPIEAGGIRGVKQWSQMEVVLLTHYLLTGIFYL